MKTLIKRKKPPVKRIAARKRIVATKEHYVLRLFVAGATARSRQAILHVRGMAETLLKDRVKLEVIDIYQQPALARKYQIVATPTLLVVLPVPVRRFIGNLTTINELFTLLDLDEKGLRLL